MYHVQCGHKLNQKKIYRSHDLYLKALQSSSSLAGDGRSNPAHFHEENINVLLPPGVLEAYFALHTKVASMQISHTFVDIRVYTQICTHLAREKWV